MAVDEFSAGLELDLSPVVHAAAGGEGRSRILEATGLGEQTSLEETRHTARRRVKVGAPTVSPGDFSDLTMEGGVLGDEDSPRAVGEQTTTRAGEQTGLGEQTTLEETRYTARRRVKVAAPTVEPGDFSDLSYHLEASQGPADLQEQEGVVQEEEEVVQEVALQEEDYLKASVGGSQSDKDVIASLRKEGEELRARLLEVEGKNKLLQEQVKRLESKEKTAQEPMEDGASIAVEASNPLEVAAAEVSEEKAEPAVEASLKEAATEDSTKVSAEVSSEASAPATSEATEAPEATTEVAAADSGTSASEDPASETPAAADTPEDSAMETESAPDAIADAPSDDIPAAADSGDC